VPFLLHRGDAGKMTHARTYPPEDHLRRDADRWRPWPPDLLLGL